MVSCRSHPALGESVDSEIAKSRTGLEADAQKFAYFLKSHSVMRITRAMRIRHEPSLVGKLVGGCHQ